MYPVMLSIRGQRILVVGGGAVAWRKVEGLLAEAARVVVVATEPIEALSELAAQNQIRLEQRPYRAGEVKDYNLVFAATDERDVNRQIYEEATAARIWVNVADDPELCSFHLPARVQRGAFQMTVASAGEAPFVVRRLRQLLERRFGEEWAEWMQAAARFRNAVRRLALPGLQSEACYDRFFAATINHQHLTARVPTAAEEAQWLGADEPSRDQAPHPAMPTHAKVTPGFVSLVGAGPGDPGLLTLRGQQRLLACDAVVYDRLAATAIPTDLPARVELRSVGKQAGRHPVPQEEINALLIRLAERGKRVVRLKGGDPYIFGRGGEEAEALVNAGIPFEIVPCVTAGVAVPAYAGIPATYRAEAVRLTLVTAHESQKGEGPQVRWDLLAQDPNATLAGYMGVTALPSVVHELLAYGMDPDTPAALIERGTTSGQKMLRSTLAELPKAMAESDLLPPGLFVIGKTVGHADKLSWFTNRPLFGQRLGCFAPAAINTPLQLNGAEVVAVPLPITPAARVVMGALPLTGWIFRNETELQALDEERDGPGFGPHVVAWCANDAVAAEARTLGWQKVATIAGDLNGPNLVAAITAY